MCGFIAQLVEQCTGNAEVTGSNPVQVLIFFRLLLSSCLNWKIYCDDHSSLSFFLKKEYNQLKGFFFMFVFSTCKEYESFILLAHKLQRHIIFGKLVEKNS